MSNNDHSGKPRIAIGPGEVAGYFSHLVSGFQRLGVRCEHFVLSSHPFEYAEHGYFLKGCNDLATRISRRGGVVNRAIGNLLRHSLRAPALLFALFRYDTFVFSGFGSFLKFHELPLLKLLGKTVIVVLVGSDARPPVLSGRHLDDGEKCDPNLLRAESRAMRKKLRRIEKHADWIICHTGTDQFLTTPYIRWAAMGLPVSHEPLPAPRREDRRIRIVHAPSRPIAKGSPVFREIVAELQHEGFDIEYVELTGVSNKRVLDELSSCDFVLDELYSDIPMAMFAAEAAILGKPAVVGSHYAADYAKHNPDAWHPPTSFVTPENMRGAVRRMVEDEEFRVLLGRRAREFVLSNWTDEQVARRYLDLLRGGFPRSWICDPSDTNYIWGWGLSSDEWRNRVGRYLKHFGVDALLIDGKPALQEKIAKEAGCSAPLRT